MTELPRFTETPTTYNFAINGVGFHAATSKDFPYTRKSSQVRKDQVDTSGDINEQGYQNFWYFSQSSLDFGAGIKYADSLKDDTLARRVENSSLVDMFDEAGEAKLVNNMRNITSSNFNSINPASGGTFSNGVLVSTEFGVFSSKHCYALTGNIELELFKYDNDWTAEDPYFGSTPNKVIIPTLVASGQFDYRTLLDLVVVGNEGFILTSDSIFKFNAADLAKPAAADITLDADSPWFYFGHGYDNETKRLFFIKDRLILTVGNKIFEIPTNATQISTTYDHIIAYNAGTTYAVGDVVEYNNKFYAAILAGTGHVPTNTTYWQVSAVVKTATNSYAFKVGSTAGMTSGDYIHGIESWSLWNIYFGSYLITNIDTVNKIVIIDTDTDVLNPAVIDTGLLYTNRYDITANKIKSWSWSGVAEGPNAIYFAGFSTTTQKSFIYRSTIELDETTRLPELTSPSVVAELPQGEKINDIITYIGTYIVVATNFGVRTGLITSDGSLVLGTLLFEKEVGMLKAVKNFVYATVPSENVVYKIDLSKTTTPNSLNFPYASDKVADKKIEIEWLTGRLLYGKNAYGIYAEETGVPVSNGLIKTARIRYNTGEDKVFQFLKLNSIKQAGTIEVYYLTNNDTAPTGNPTGSGSTNGWHYLRTVNTLTEPSVEFDGSDAAPHLWIQYAFLFRSVSGSTPVLLSYQVKAQPANIKQRDISVPLMCFDRERPLRGVEVQNSVYDRITGLEAAEKTGAVVLFQDLGTGEEHKVNIDTVQYIQQYVGDPLYDNNNNGGLIYLTLRTVD